MNLFLFFQSKLSLTLNILYTETHYSFVYIGVNVKEIKRKFKSDRRIKITYNTIKRHYKKKTITEPEKINAPCTDETTIL